MSLTHAIVYGAGELLSSQFVLFQANTFDNNMNVRESNFDEYSENQSPDNLK